jgi:hypothetical protein
MWRSILAVFLAPVLTAAQTVQTEGAVTPEPCKPATHVAKQPVLPTYRAYAYYNRIRRGSEEKLGVQLMLGADVTTTKSAARGIVPLSLELQPADGLTVKDVRYPKVSAKKVKFQTEPLKVASPPNILFKLRADKNAALGPRVLKGKLTFQPIPHDGSAPGTVQTVDVEIPITVVDHDEKVQRAAYPFPETPVALYVALIVFAPLLVAAVVVSSPFWITCLASQACMD